MSDIRFELSDAEFDGEDDYDGAFCSCEQPQWMLSIMDGAFEFTCAECKGSTPETWVDFHDMVVMSPVPVTLRWEKEPCVCETHPDRLSCDCDAYLVVTPKPGATEGENKK